MITSTDQWAIGTIDPIALIAEATPGSLLSGGFARVQLRRFPWGVLSPGWGRPADRQRYALPSLIIMAPRTLERLALGTTSVGCAGALALYVYLIIWPSWQQHRQTAAMLDRIAQAMEKRMAEVAVGDTENLANEIQGITKADLEGPYPRWDKITLLLIPLGLAFLAFVGFLALRFGVRLAVSEIVLLVSLAGILVVLPAWLPSKAEFEDFFVRVTLVAATIVGTIAAVFVVAKGKVSVYAVVGATLLASSVCGAALGFLMAMPAWHFASVVAHMLIGAAAGSFPGTLAGVIAGYLYGRAGP